MMLTAGTAWAGESPRAVKQDVHVQTVAYDADNPVYLHLRAGFVTDLRVSDKELVTDVFLSSRPLIDAKISGHDVLLKVKLALKPEPLFVKARRADGSDRVYPFVVDAIDPEPPEGFPKEPGAAMTVASLAAVAAPPVDDGRPYIVRIVYPADAALEAKQKREAAAAAWRAKQETVAVNERMREPAPVVINTQYQGQGSQDLAPNAAWDDGRTTFFRYDGNRHLPVPFVIGVDGKPAVGDYTINGRTLEIHQTAKQFRLIDGDTALCVFNGNWTAEGHNTGTGTTRPDVVREIGK